MTVETPEPTPANAIDGQTRKREWLRYYSQKRIGEQLLQVQMLDGLAVDTVLEVGPYFGLVSAMLDNAGYAVTTMDVVAPSFAKPALPHVIMDLTAIEPGKLAGFDCIMCCATLEHIRYQQAEAALAAFHGSGSRYVVISVPYMGTQFFLRMYLNRHAFAQHVSFKKLRWLRRFSFDEAADPWGHKWEIGYRGYSLRKFERTLDSIGFKRLRREFSYPSYSVFYTLENPAA